MFLIIHPSRLEIKYHKRLDTWIDISQATIILDAYQKISVSDCWVFDTQYPINHVCVALKVATKKWESKRVMKKSGVPPPKLSIYILTWLEVSKQTNAAEKRSTCRPSNTPYFCFFICNQLAIGVFIARTKGCTPVPFMIGPSTFQFFRCGIESENSVYRTLAQNPTVFEIDSEANTVSE